MDKEEKEIEALKIKYDSYKTLLFAIFGFILTLIIVYNQNPSFVFLFAFISFQIAFLWIVKLTNETYKKLMKSLK